jgi:hypothetical protein
LHTAKILIFIAAIIALIFGSSIFTNHLLSTHAQSLEEKILKVEAHTREQKWEAAQTELAAIEKEWPKVENTWTILLDHSEIDNIDESLSKVSEYIKAKSAPLALAELATLKRYVKHIPEKEALSIKNVL